MDLAESRTVILGIRGEIRVLDMMRLLKLSSGDSWGDASTAIVSEESDMTSTSLICKPMKWKGISAFVLIWSHGGVVTGTGMVEHPKNPVLSAISVEDTNGRTYNYYWNPRTERYDIVQ